MQKKVIPAIVFCTFTSLSNATELKVGPQQDSLYPTAFYLDPGDGLYVEFQSGSMPGCSHNKGGRLAKANPNYKELYSLMLTMMASKTFKGTVRYKETTSSGWWHCSIEGLNVFPK
jgi:hypothetical protein